MNKPIPAASPPAPYIKAHDAFFRHAFAHPDSQRGLLRYAWKELRLEAAVPTGGPTLGLADAEITVVDASFTGGKSADLVLQVSMALRPILVLLEHKSSRDRRTALQLMGYSVALASRMSAQDPIVIPIVFYHGTHRWKQIHTPTIVGFTFKPLVLDLRYFARQGTAELEAKIGARATAALLVMARVRFELAEQDVREVLSHLSAAAIDSQFRRELLWYFTYHTPRVNREMILKLAAEPQYNAIGGDAMTMRESYVLEGKLEGILEGKIEGKIEGKQEGRKEGMVEARREIVQNALRQGFELETIAHLTGLDIASIEQLANEETIEEGGNGSH